MTSIQKLLGHRSLNTANPLPRDVPIDQLRQLLHQIEQEVTANEGGRQRQALMDRAWILLMLHSGLRTSEIRYLRLEDINLTTRQVRIEGGKGLQDRIVFLSQEGVEALQAYLAVRGPAVSDHVFIYRHQPVGRSYCGARLQTYGRGCGLRITPHQLSYSCATLLPNARVPILTV